ncbi:effector protein Tle3 domain-containing protein [Burkholderia multivorans]|uniref:effector protein Tle3 domain-containing protein n=1 Tax=Burkholderia multivorans TaxID=87883 RepID=UPI0020187ABF|nr:DUF3274 domain-containing protein [Burkholderia multivorans]MCO1401698.1 DUF3274 domain-containing protein [Burkholderia multivorans]UQO76591.1 DUF3274 domain-containing protein [Burkholderia multivorans]
MVGQARAIDDPEWAKLLRSLADWRIPLAKMQKNARFSQLDATTLKIVNANFQYYDKGIFPSEDIVPTTPPEPVVTEIVKLKDDVIKARRRQIEEQVRSNPFNNIPLP